MLQCKKCYATGFISYFENQSPLGSGMTWNEELIELCDECAENDQCPSCRMFWKGQNKEFNEYCEGNGEEFGCIFCLWKSTDPVILTEPNEDYYMLTPEERFKASSRRKSEWRF